MVTLNASPLLAALAVCAGGTQSLLGYWSQRDTLNYKVDLRLRRNMTFTSHEYQPSQTKPLPDVFMSGSWWRQGNRLLLRPLKRREVYPYGTFKNGKIKPVTGEIWVVLRINGLELGTPLMGRGASIPIKLFRTKQPPRPAEWKGLQ